MLEQNDQMLKMYIKDISIYTLIDAEAEKKLSDIIQKSPSETERRKAKDKLVTSNLRLVISIAIACYKKTLNMNGVNITVMDLIQAGNVGLMRAADLFKSENNVRFSTYAYLSIERFIKRMINSSRLIRLPPNSFVHLARMKDIDDGDKILTDKEIIKKLGIEQKTLSALRKSRNQIVSVDNFEELLDRTRSEEIPLDEILNQRELREYLLSKMSELSPMEKWTVFYRFLGNEEMTLGQVSKKFGVSKERIRKAQNVALRRLRQKIEEDKVKIKGGKNENKTKIKPFRKMVRRSDETYSAS